MMQKVRYSFDEYIDNLVIGTESEIDEDDLFQEVPRGIFLTNIIVKIIW